MKSSVLYTSVLQALIEEAYQLFDYPVKGRLSVCTECCISEERMQELMRIPIRKLSLSAVYDYLDAVHYDEEGSEIKHFLPRILELLVQGEELSFDTELYLQRCHFNKPCWNEKEKNFLNRFFTAFFRQILSTDIKYCNDTPENYLSMIALSGFNPEPLLEVWEEMCGENLTALFHFQKFIYNYGYGYQTPFLKGNHFENTLNAWANSAALAEKILPKIEKLYFEEEKFDEETLYHLEIFHQRMQENLKR